MLIKYVGIYSIYSILVQCIWSLSILLPHNSLFIALRIAKFTRRLHGKPILFGANKFTVKARNFLEGIIFQSGVCRIEFCLYGYFNRKWPWNSQTKYIGMMLDIILHPISFPQAKKVSKHLFFWIVHLFLFAYIRATFYLRALQLATVQPRACAASLNVCFLSKISVHGTRCHIFLR